MNRLALRTGTTITTNITRTQSHRFVAAVSSLPTGKLPIATHSRIPWTSVTFQNRHIQTTTPRMSSTTDKKKGDWSANQYLKFGDQRTRPVRDLIAQVAPLVSASNPMIYDLGCGPGNSTSALLDQFPTAKIRGVDSSPDMLKKARATLPNVPFSQADLSTFSIDASKSESGGEPDLLFSNAVLHWLRHDERIPTIVRLFQSLKKGGVLAFQVPDNYDEPSHACMRDTALVPDAPWSRYFADVKIGDLDDKTRPDLDPIPPPNAFLNALLPYADSGAAEGGVRVWETEYFHVLPTGVRGIVEWVRGSGLMPFLERIPGDAEGVREEFLKEYEKRLGSVGKYEGLEGGKGVVLGYPRLFVVAVRGGE